MNLPLVMYQPFADFDREGVANAGDFTASIDDALDYALEAMKFKATGWRILRTELDPDTNMPIHCTDVTADAIELHEKRMRGRAA